MNIKKLKTSKRCRVVSDTSAEKVRQRVRKKIKFLRERQAYLREMIRYPHNHVLTGPINEIQGINKTVEMLEEFL